MLEVLGLTSWVEMQGMPKSVEHQDCFDLSNSLGRISLGLLCHFPLDMASVQRCKQSRTHSMMKAGIESYSHRE